MDIFKTFIIVLVFFAGCNANMQKGNRFDPRPPLINNTAFTNYIPIVVTNQFQASSNKTMSISSNKTNGINND